MTDAINSIQLTPTDFREMRVIVRGKNKKMKDEVSVRPLFL